MHSRAHNMRAMILDPTSTYLCNNIVDPYFPAAHYGLKHIWPRREHRSRTSEWKPAGRHVSACDSPWTWTDKYDVTCVDATQRALMYIHNVCVCVHLSLSVSPLYIYTFIHITCVSRYTPQNRHLRRLCMKGWTTLGVATETHFFRRPSGDRCPVPCNAPMSFCCQLSCQGRRDIQRAGETKISMEWNMYACRKTTKNQERLAIYCGTHLFCLHLYAAFGDAPTPFLMIKILELCVDGLVGSWEIQKHLRFLHERFVFGKQL